MYKKFIIWNLIAALGVLSLCPAVRGADKTTDKSVEVRTLSLVPAGEPVPAMSYRLLPRYLDQKTGNAALFYYSAAALCPDKEPEDIQEKINDWRDKPVDQLDRKEVDEALSYFSNCFHQIKLAAQRTHCQWNPLPMGAAPGGRLCHADASPVNFSSYDFCDTIADTPEDCGWTNCSSAGNAPTRFVYGQEYCPGADCYSGFGWNCHHSFAS
jgi:hypothetical protein